MKKYLLDSTGNSNGIKRYMWSKETSCESDRYLLGHQQVTSMESTDINQLTIQKRVSHELLLFGHSSLKQVINGYFTPDYDKT